MPRTKKIKGWAIVCKKDIYGYLYDEELVRIYQAGDLAQIALSRRDLPTINFQNKYFKIVPIEVSYTLPTTKAKKQWKSL